MLKYDYQDSVGYWVFSTAHEMSHRMNAELAKLGITFRQWEVLCWTSLFREVSQAELAERMLIEAPTLAGILDRMERDGWITRVSDPNDGRKKLIRHAERVEPVWDMMVEKARLVRAEATEGLDEEELRVLRTLLEKIRRNLAGDECIDQIERLARGESDGEV